MFDLGHDGQVVAAGQSVAGVLECGQEFERFLQVVIGFPRADQEQSSSWLRAATSTVLVGLGEVFGQWR